MKIRWDALDARARGLGASLLTEDELAALDRSSGVLDFARALEKSPYARFLLRREADAASVDVAVTRSLADRLATLARWAGPGGAALTPLFLEQDARNVRVILRGVLGELTPEQQLSACIPTPTLGRRALEHLARADSAGAVAGALLVWGHPIGATILSEAARTHSDLLRLEATLARWWVAAALQAARPGGRAMLRFVRETVDVQNVLSAQLLSTTRSESPPGTFFIEGGAAVDRGAYVRAESTGDPNECAETLARATRGTLFEAPLGMEPATPAALSARLLDARIRGLVRDAREDPLSAFPVILFVLRLRREASRVRRALWGAALAAGRSP